METQTVPTKAKVIKSKYETIPSYALAALLVLLPAFFIPFSHVSFLFAKVGLIFLIAFIGLTCLILNILNERKVGVPSWLYLGVTAGLPVSYLLSSLFSRDIGASLIGQGTDVDTFFFVALGTLLSVLAARFLGDKKRILTSVLALLLVSLILSLFHVLRYVFGTGFLSLGIFGTITSNTVGSFSDLGIFAGLSVILSILTLEFLSLSRNVRIALSVSLGLSLIVACVSNFYLVTSVFGLQIPIALTAILAFFSLVILVHKKVSNPKQSFPHITLAVFLVALVCTVQAQNIATALGTSIGITQNEALDIRVSPSSTAYVAGQVMTDGIRDAAFGTGPNRFFSAWAAHKPTELGKSINSTGFWGTDFNLGFGFVPTAIVTGGIVESIAWILFLGLILYSVYRLFRQLLKGDRDPLTVYSILVASIGTVYLWLFAVIYTPGPVILPLAFFFTGLLGAMLLGEGIIKVRFVAWDKAGYWKSFSIVFGLVAAIALLVGAGYVWSNRLIASIYADRAVAMLQVANPDIAGAETLMAQAISSYPSSSYLRFYSDVSLARPLQLISKSEGAVKPETITQEIAGDMYKSIAAAEYSAFGRSASLDYRDWIQLGKTYEAATFLGATSTATRAAQSYAQAELLAPTSPLPPFLLGRLFVYARQKDLAVAELNKSLALKPDYEDAGTLLQALNPIAANTPEVALPPAIPANVSTSTEKAAVKPGAKTTATTTKR